MHDILLNMIFPYQEPTFAELTAVKTQTPELAECDDKVRRHFKEKGF